MLCSQPEILTIRVMLQVGDTEPKPCLSSFSTEEIYSSYRDVALVLFLMLPVCATLGTAACKPVVQFGGLHKVEMPEGL